MKLAGEVNLTSYDGNGKIRIGTLLDLDLSGPEKKDQALAIFKSVEKVGQEMKEYQLMENNCRDYVIAGSDVRKAHNRTKSTKLEHV